MKSSLIGITVCMACVAEAKPQLINLHNADQLPTADQLNPMESFAHLETFDPIPIYGGEELRDRMLEEERRTKSA